MGRSASSASPSARRRLPIGAAPAAMAGLAAAAVALGNTPAASAATADAAVHHATAAPAAPAAPERSGAFLAQLVSITGQSGTGAPVIALDTARVVALKPKGKHHRTLPAKYIVKPGDTLASIAQHFYHSAAYWTVLYAANQHKIPWADDIQAGLVLTVPAKPAKAPAAPAATTAPAPAPAAASASGSGQGYSASTTPQAAPAPATNDGSGSSFQECVIAAESGGNPQVMSAGGYYGLYQFSAATWAAYGGNPADWGNASVAEQNQVFENAIAAGGASNWAPYDGC